MAFMMPVVKNDWDIYKSQRSRRVSECSTVGGGTSTSGGRSRKVSESRSEGPGSLCGEFGASPAHRSVPSNMSARQYSYQQSRSCSRTSSNSLQGGTGSGSSASPSKSAASSPPKHGSGSALSATKASFHTRLMDKLKPWLRHSKDKEDERSSA